MLINPIKTKGSNNMNDLLEILNLSEEKALNTKFKFNLNVDGNKNRSAEQLLKHHFDDFINMTAFRQAKSGTNNLDNAKYVVSLAKDTYYTNRYLFGGLYYVEPLSNLKNIDNAVGYRLYSDTTTQKYIKNMWVVVNKNVGMAITRNYKSAEQIVDNVILKNK